MSHHAGDVDLLVALLLECMRGSETLYQNNRAPLWVRSANFPFEMALLDSVLGRRIDAGL